MKKSALAIAALGTLVLSACGAYQIVEPLGENHYKITTYQPNWMMPKSEADYVLSLVTDKVCPSGWKTLKEYQLKGQGYPIFNWEIECL